MMPIRGKLINQWLYSQSVDNYENVHELHDHIRMWLDANSRGTLKMCVWESVRPMNCDRMRHN